MSLALIAAVARNGVIGQAGHLPWRLPADLQRFKTLTMGHHLIIGRRTWDELGKPLPGRTMIVISRRRDFAPAGAQVVTSLDAALELARQDSQPFVAGGAEIYALALPLARRFYLTRVLAEVDGDTRFPTWNESEWRLVERQPHPADDRHPYAMEFLTYDRRMEEMNR